MKKISTLLTLFILAAGIVKADPITIKISKSKEDRQVSNFSGVAASGNVDVIIKMGNTESLRLEGDADMIADLITEVKGNVLNIKPKTKFYNNNKYRNARVTAYITAKKINSLIMSGSGEMRVEDALTTNSFNATLSGSGSIKARGTFSNFNGVISGSGSINISGKTDDANVTISGSGSFAGKDFHIENLTAQTSGSGSINVDVNSAIRAVISGSGSINYSGNATVQKTTVGSGRVRKV